MPYSAGLVAGVSDQAGYFDAGSSQDRHSQRYLLTFKSVGSSENESGAGCLFWCL